MKNNEITDYESEKLIIDCTDVLLEPYSGDILTKLDGPGSIIQKVGGGFLLKVFVPKVDIRSAFGRINRIKAGKIIESSEYYRMSATDIAGNVWTCKRLLPHFSSSFEALKSIITADLVEISKTDPLPKKVSRSILQMKFKGSFKIPANAGTHIIKEVADLVKEEKSNLNVCTFISCKIDIGIIQEDGWMTVNASSADREFDEVIARRITEAIELCLSRQLRWSSRKIITFADEYHILRGVIPNENTGRIYPPVNYNDPGNVCDAIRLMDCYLLKTIESKKTSVHPLFYPLYEVILASQSTTESEALVLATSIESMLDNITITVEQDEEMVECIKQLRNSIDSANYPKSFKKRLYGLIGMMVFPSAADKLHILAQENVISKDLIDIWKKLRHKLAHGNNSISDFQEFLDMTHAIHVLLHFLLFHCIGYSGNYTDYSKEGWPIRIYPIVQLNPHSIKS